jgi:hypothetical protein
MSEAWCKACGAKMRWLPTEKGKAAPLNAKPDPNGNIVIRPDMFGQDTAVYVGKGVEVADDEPRYTSHFADCPEAKSFRRDR